MTATELHIDLDLQLQKINTNSTRNILSEEKDWFLNNEVAKFINKRTRDISDFKRKGLEEDTKRLKDIEPLIKTIPIDVETVDTEKGRFILPSSVFKYVSIRTEFGKVCDEVTIKKGTRNLNVRFLTVDTDVDDNFSITLSIAGTVYSIFSTQNLPDTYRWETKEYLIKAIKVALQSINDKLPENHGIEVYYEWFADTYKENTFFFVGGSTFNGASASSLSLDIDIGISFKSSTYSYEQVRAEKTIKRPARLVSHELIDVMLSSDISGSIGESPLCTTDKHYGYAYHPSNTIIEGVKLTYICKPNIIDIHLGTSLNLDRDICAEVVVHTAKFIKALLDSGNYEKYFNETNLIE